jgi:hypothetical protein
MRFSWACRAGRRRPRDSRPRGHARRRVRLAAAGRGRSPGARRHGHGAAGAAVHGPAVRGRGRSRPRGLLPLVPDHEFRPWWSFARRNRIQTSCKAARSAGVDLGLPGRQRARRHTGRGGASGSGRDECSTVVVGGGSVPVRAVGDIGTVARRRAARAVLVRGVRNHAAGRRLRRRGGGRTRHQELRRVDRRYLQLWVQCHGDIGHLLPCHGLGYVVARAVRVLGFSMPMSAAYNAGFMYVTNGEVCFERRADGWYYSRPPAMGEEWGPSVGPFAEPEQVLEEAARTLELPSRCASAPTACRCSAIRVSSWWSATA